MTAEWHFNQPNPGDKNREPVLGEFFATEAINNAAEALVREGIQNALDAGITNELVRVRIYISGDKGALPAELATEYFEGAWNHFEADGNGLQDRPARTENCSFLTFEDFGTTGLVGDITQWHDIPGVKNPFYFFFRAEGQSAKSEQDRGRWGVGKTVFPRSSRVSSYFGLTVRSDDMNRFMMGQAVLKSHPLDDQFYSPDGYLGIRRTDGLTLPIGDSWTINKFCKDFRIQRAQEPGLSVVVPYCDPEINERVLLTAVCRDYFYPILAAKLEVTVETPNDVHLIDSETIREVAKSIDRDLPNDYLEMIELAEWATELPPKQIKRIESTAFGYPPTWSKSLFTDDQLIEIRNSIHAGDPIAIRIPVQVREKNESSRDSYFDVFMIRRGESESGRPVFIREGIIISDVRSPRSRGVLSLVVVEDRPLAGLLGDSENPAHTQWQRNSSHFKGKYIYAPYYIPFVTRSVAEILQITVEEEEKSDPSLLIDFFSLATEKPVATKAQEPKRSPKGQEPDKPEIPPSPPRFRINRLAGGFSVKRGSEEAELPPFLRIRTAYDVRRGGALKKYNPADFSLDEMEVMAAGATIQKIGGNELFIAVNEAEFQIDVSGFDEQRDLLVDVKVKEGSDDSST